MFGCNTSLNTYSGPPIVREKFPYFSSPPPHPLKDDERMYVAGVLKISSDIEPVNVKYLPPDADGCALNEPVYVRYIPLCESCAITSIDDDIGRDSADAEKTFNPKLPLTLRGSLIGGAPIISFFLSSYSFCHCFMVVQAFLQEVRPSITEQHYLDSMGQCDSKKSHHSFRF